MGRYFVPGLPHTKMNLDFNACAFTMKQWRFAKGMTANGHEVIYVGNKDADKEVFSDCIEVVDDDFFVRYTGIDYSSPGSHNNIYEMKENHPDTYTFHLSAVSAIRQRVRPGDYVLINYGLHNEQIMDHLWDLINLPVFLCEMSIGYTGAIKGPYKVFESHSVREFTKGQWDTYWANYLATNPNEEDPVPFGAVPNTTAQWTDDTIHAFLDPLQFERCDEKGDYFMFIGRLIWTKGLSLAALVCERIGAKLLVFGQGDIREALGSDTIPSCIDFMGHADIETRRKYMSKAKGGICSYSLPRAVRSCYS